MVRGKGAKFNGLSGFIKGDDGYTYHFEKEDFRTEEFFKEAKWLSKKKLFRQTDFFFTPKKRKSGNMQEATDIWFEPVRKKKDTSPEICPFCHKNVHIRHSFCPWCGTKLNRIGFKTDGVLYKITRDGATKIDTYLAELQAKRKEILEAEKDTAVDTPLPSKEDILSDIELIGLDDTGSYFNGWGVTDNYDADTVLELTIGKDFIKVE